MSAEKNKLRAGELRGHSDEELQSLVKSLGEELFKYRLQRYTNQLENTMQIRKVRRDLARVKTIIAARTQGFETRRVGAMVEPSEDAPAKKAAAKSKTSKAKPAKAAAAKKTKKAAAQAQE